VFTKIQDFKSCRIFFVRQYLEIGIFHLNESGKTKVYKIILMRRLLLSSIRLGSILVLILIATACSLPQGSPSPVFVEINTGQSASTAWTTTDSLYLADGVFNPGLSVHTWWLKTTIQNPDLNPARLFLVLNNPHINRIDVFMNREATPVFKAGDRFPFSERPVQDRDIIIPLDIGPQDSVEVLILLDKAGETLTIETEVLTEAQLSKKRQGENMIIGLVIGWMALILIFSCFFWLRLKQSSALFYAAFILSNLLWLICHWGIGFQYLWPESVEWVGKSRPIFNLATLILFMLVVMQFFPPLQKSRWIAQIIWGNIIIMTILCIGFIVVPEDQTSLFTKITALQFSFGLTILSILAVLVFLILQWNANVPFAGFYLIGIGFLMVFGVLILFDQHGFEAGETFGLLKFSTAFGMMGETAFIAAAFTRKAAAYKFEKEHLAFEILQKEKEVAEQIIEVQEDERNRLGRDLHDSIGGMLASINIQAEQIFHQYPEAAVGKLKELVSQSIREARSLSHNLTPPHLDEFGLEKVLQNHITLLAEQHQLDINFYFQVKPTLSKAVEISLYRICNELLYNIVKHANATEAMLNLIEENGNLELIVEDNGKGIDPNKKSEGIGLRNIRERVNYLKGELSIDSNSSGTTTIIKIPIHV
jgi:signal transduction histidine kinase